MFQSFEAAHWRVSNPEAEFPPGWIRPYSPATAAGIDYAYQGRGSGAEVQFQNPKPEGGRQRIAPQLISAKNKDILCHKEMFVTMIAASFSILKVKLLRYGLCLASAAAPEQSREIFRLFIVEVDEIWPPCRAINSV